MQMSQELVDAGNAALEAVDSKDPDAVFAAGETVYVACDRCHQRYWIDATDRSRIREPARPHRE
jgi:hypothetical protein